MEAFLVKIKKWIIILAVIFAGCLIGSQAWAADTAVMSPNEGILDPFTLTTYQPAARSKNVIEDDGFMNETLIFDALLESTSSGPPLPTLRRWIRVPFRPPVRSPFVPWWI